MGVIDSIKQEVRGPGCLFTVKNAVMTASINIRVINCSSGVISHKTGTDPLTGIKDLIPISDKLKVMKFVHKEQDDWGS
jgi:hypothetical protein